MAHRTGILVCHETADGSRFRLVRVFGRPVNQRPELRLEPVEDAGHFPGGLVAVELAHLVDSSTPADYEGAWQRWREACRMIQGICIGDIGTPENFTIESDWRIEWLESDETSPQISMRPSLACVFCSAEVGAENRRGGRGGASVRWDMGGFFLGLDVAAVK